jgi:hypothetical protein
MLDAGVEHIHQDVVRHPSTAVRVAPLLSPRVLDEPVALVVPAHQHDDVGARAIHAIGTWEVDARTNGSFDASVYFGE